MTFLAQFDALHEMAAEATGLDDFGSDDYIAPMRLLLGDIDKHARLNEVGVQSTQEALLALLVGRLTAQQGFKTLPASADTPIERPVVIVGLPRTGTTVLHRLLAADPMMQSLPFWLSNLPMPRPPRDTWETHPAYLQILQGLQTMDESMPGWRTIHPIYADRADECRWSIDQSFWATTQAALSRVPEYRDWLVSTDPYYAYDYHRRVLQLVANGDSRRWMLKDPSHLFALETLLDVFPGACVIFTHREPTHAMSSLTKLVCSMRQHREVDVTPSQLATDMLELWAVAIQKSEAARRHCDPKQFIDVHMDETRADPIGTAERIYRHFDFPLSDATRAAWQTAITSRSTLAHATQRQNPEEFGLTKDRVASALGAYWDRYKRVRDEQEVGHAD